GGAARRAGSRDLRAGREDRRHAALRAGADQEGGQPGRGSDGHALGHGFGVRPASLRARAQRRGRGGFAGRHERQEHAGHGHRREQHRREERDGLMDLELDQAALDFQREVREFLAANKPARPLPSMDTAEGFEAHREWERKLAEARLSVVAWPQEYGGRNASLIDWVLFEQEYYAAQAPARVGQNGIFLLAPTLFEPGTKEPPRS